MSKRNVKWASCAAAVLMMGLFYFYFSPRVLARSHEPSASKLFKLGEQAEARDDIEAAYENYYQAYQKKPEDIRYKAAWERTRFTAATLHVKHGETLRDQGDITGALTEFLRALQIDPSNELATQEIRATRRQEAEKSAARTQSWENQGEPIPAGEAKQMGELGGPIHLRPLSNEPLTIHATEDSKVVYQTVGKMAGINVLFDPDYTSKRIQVDLANTDLYDALRIIGVVSGTFWQAITPNTIFVAQNTRAKRNELQQQAVQTFYLTNVAQQNDFTDIQTALRNMFQTAKIYGVASQDAIIMRGTPDELMLAQKLIDDLDKAKPEVVVDVAVLEVSKNWERNIGIQLPQTATVGFQASNYNTTNNNSGSTTDQNGSTTTGSNTNTSNGLTLNSFAHLNGTNFAVTIGQAQANLLLTNTSTEILQDPRIRASDGQEASLKIGERIPIATGSYQTGAATAIVSSLVNTQFQYLDVGVNIKVKPTVHYDRDVTLKLTIEVSSQNGSTNIGGITEPIITQRTVDQTIRLKEGEANILGGILQRQTSNNLSGTPGLAKLPLLKYIFGDNDKTERDDQIVFLLIPHVVRAEMLDPLNLREVDSGTTNDIQLRHMNIEKGVSEQQQEGESPVMLGAPAKTAAAPAATPNVASVPGAATAAGAAAAAVANMQAAAGPVHLNLAPEMQNAKVGQTFQVKVNLADGTDVYSVPLQLQYDQTKLSLINVDLGDTNAANGMDFLGKDGQAVALVHRDDGNGNVAISASRPPGAKGVNGAGTVCVLTFKAKAPGPAAVVVTKPVVRNSEQKAEPAVGSRAIVQVQQ